MKEMGEPKENWWPEVAIAFLGSTNFTLLLFVVLAPRLNGVFTGLGNEPPLFAKLFESVHFRGPLIIFDLLSIGLVVLTGLFAGWLMSFFRARGRQLKRIRIMPISIGFLILQLGLVFYQVLAPIWSSADLVK
jgi:hypothetical protein